MAVDAKTWEKAAAFYVYQGLSLSEIEGIEGMPSRQTMAKGRDLGLGLGGRNWDEAREEHQKSLVLAAKSEAFMESRETFNNMRNKALRDINDAILKLSDLIKAAPNTKSPYKDLRDLYEFALKLEAGTAHEMILSFIEEFLEDVGKVIIKRVNDSQATQLILVDLKDLLSRYQERLDPIKEFAQRKK